MKLVTQVSNKIAIMIPTKGIALITIYNAYTTNVAATRIIIIDTTFRQVSQAEAAASYMFIMPPYKFLAF